ncbi:hypothetical protein M5C72_07085 [Companilactobacillus allii]|uniref:Uncharacterized protein n=1 Tax=Companilactobacillus allii TaxID=1847728 RepID=A0A1P8Q4U2_9LACO|nr:hypothetical protein [Companilactobacillus allii]APX72861.1 hypothetical protein BTM29_10000 [Companilactobacillus allii]USQ67649.1 hypothetical protein M5C72_07085 [Companilactobacillus allii]
MVKIEVPSSELKFEIGIKKFNLSLADKSRGKYAESFNKIALQESKDVHKQDIELTELNQKFADLEAKYATSEDMTEAQYRKQRAGIEDTYYKKIQRQSHTIQDRQLQLIKGFLNDCFGEGSGDEIYKICGQSSAVLRKVVIQINAELEKSIGTKDYYDNYMSKLKDMKDDESTTEESADIQKQEVSN